MLSTPPPPPPCYYVVTEDHAVGVAGDADQVAVIVTDSDLQYALLDADGLVGKRLHPDAQVFGVYVNNIACHYSE